MANSVKPLTITYLLSARRFMLLSVAAGVVTVGLIVFAILPQAQAVFGLLQQRQEESDRLVALQEKLAQLQLVSEPGIMSQIELVDLLLPSKKPLIELMNSLGAISERSQVTLEGITLSPGSLSTSSAELSQNLGPTADLSVEMNAKGTLAQLNTFFADVERTTPLITITELGLSSSNVDEAQVPEDVFSQQYTAKLTLDAAYFTRSVTSAVESSLPEVTAKQQQILQELASFTILPTPPQSDVVGGGLDDLFGIESPETEAR